MEERLRLLEEQIEVLKSENDVLKDPDAKTKEREDPSKDIVNVWREKLTATASLTDKADEEKKEMVSLRAGDLVWFRLQDESQRGIVLGGWRQRNVLVKPDDDGNEFVPPLLIRDGIFRLCSRFNYRSKVEVSKITKAMRQSSDDDPGSPKRDLQFAKKRMASEAVQNAQLLKKLVRCAPEDAREPIHYGDVVQLQHVSSGKNCRFAFPIKIIKASFAHRNFTPFSFLIGSRLTSLNQSSLTSSNQSLRQERLLVSYFTSSAVPW